MNEPAQPPPWPYGSRSAQPTGRTPADAVYAGVEAPLTASDVAECIVWTLERPAHVNIDSLTVRPRAQASNTVVARG